jgi:DNA-binding protein YbaB
VSGPVDAPLESLGAQVQKQVAAIRQAAERAAELTVSVASGDGLVRVEVGAQGQLRSVRLVAGAYDQMPADQLAEVITRLAQRAAAEAAEQAQEIIVLPGRLPAGRAWWEWLPDAAGGVE